MGHRYQVYRAEKFLCAGELTSGKGFWFAIIGLTPIAGTERVERKRFCVFFCIIHFRHLFTKQALITNALDQIEFWYDPSLQMLATRQRTRLSDCRRPRLLTGRTRGSIRTWFSWIGLSKNRRIALKSSCPRKAGIQDKQSLMNSRFPSIAGHSPPGVGRCRGNDAEWKFLDSPLGGRRSLC